MASVCRICDAEILARGRGRPPLYCSPRCKRLAAVFAEVERTIAVARAEGRAGFAEERAAWLAGERADARHGFAGSRAKLAEINQRIREYR